MKNHVFTTGLMAALAVSCSTYEMDFKDTNAFEEFYASIENDEITETKVYATEELYLRWNADDRITIFNKYTYNQEYRFTGETGDNSGSFRRVDNGDFVTGNSLDNIYAIYPYQESTKISDTGVITVTLPAEQTYAENTMGLGANTMISATTDNQLLFKNVGGYLMLKLYGDDVTVSSITLKGNNGERIAGRATVSMPINGVPTVEMSETAGQDITLVCETPLRIGSTAETATTFWLVVPPTVFSKGFTLTVKDNSNGVFEKRTSKSFEIGRNKLARMAVLEYVSGPSDDFILFADQKVKERLVAKFDKDGDGELSFEEAQAVTSISGVFDKADDITSFNEFQYFTNVANVPEECFAECNHLSSVILPSSIRVIGTSAFENCSILSSINLSKDITVNDKAFKGTALSGIVYVNTFYGEAFCNTGITDIFTYSAVRDDYSSFDDCLWGVPEQSIIHINNTVYDDMIERGVLLTEIPDEIIDLNTMMFGQLSSVDAMLSYLEKRILDMTSYGYSANELVEVQKEIDDIRYRIIMLREQLNRGVSMIYNNVDALLPYYMSAF